MNAKPLKAYVVTEECDNSADIYFARHRITAHKDGANELGDGELHGVTCRRAPEFDQYAEAGYVPWSVRIGHGWWIECSECGQRISEDAEDDDGEQIDFDIVEAHGQVFCRPACEQQFLIDKVETARIQAHVIGQMTDWLVRKMPGATVLDPGCLKKNHCYVPPGSWPRYPKEASIAFTFPGAQFTSTFKWKLGEVTAHAWVPRGDLPAFHRWRAEGCQAHMMDASEAA